MIESVHTRSLIRLKILVEEQLGWGGTAHWRSYDFEKLSEKIQEKTGVVLSISTLKRIFGKVSYESSPSVTTLNTLSQFIGYADWRTFCNAEPDEKPITATVKEDLAGQSIAVKKRNVLPKSILIAAALLLGGWFAFYGFSKKQTGNHYSFSSKTIQTEGLPNSVIFDYDASAAGVKDSVFIAQSWDTRRKVWVSRTGKHHSSIYYYPGYFRAKLMISEQIVKEHDIQIRTNGWLGLIAADWGKEPFYFKQNEIVRSGEISIDQALLEKYHIPSSPDLPEVRLFNQKDIHGILTDDFTFETEVKTTAVDVGNNVCQRVEILLQSKNDIMIVPLIHPACVGDISLAAFGFYTDSQKDDLSGFGCHLNDWAKLKVVCTNRQIRFLVNEKEAYTAKIASPATEIVGVQFRFKGAGAVRNTKLSGKGESQVAF